MYDCIVVGLGGLGSSALYHLARRGISVLGLEQFEPAHIRGSSHGETRIIRRAYFEHTDYVPLLLRAYELWHELHQQSGQQLYIPNGVLLCGPPDGQAISGSVKSAAEHGIEIDRWCVNDHPDRLPMLRFPPDFDVVLEPEAGYLKVEECVRAHIDGAIASGAVSHFREPVLSWASDGKTVSVVTGKTTYTAGTLILAGGAWASTLVGDIIPRLQVLRKLQFWHAVDDAEHSSLAELPAFLLESDSGVFYGLPSSDTGQVKIARHSGGLIVNPSDPDCSDDGEETRAVESFVRDHLTGVSAHAVRQSPCLYTMTPDSHFIVDQHPDLANVVYGAGFSGHGFKFTSVLGEALADLATRGRSSLPIRFLSNDRFTSLRNC